MSGSDGRRIPRAVLDGHLRARARGLSGRGVRLHRRGATSDGGCAAARTGRTRCTPRIRWRFPRDARTAYNLGAKDLFFLDRALQKSERPVRVIYHSHVDVGAYFSAEDERAAVSEGELLYPVDYLVVDVRRRRRARRQAVPLRRRPLRRGGAAMALELGVLVADPAMLERALDAGRATSTRRSCSSWTTACAPPATPRLRAAIDDGLDATLVRHGRRGARRGAGRRRAALRLAVGPRGHGARRGARGGHDRRRASTTTTARRRAADGAWRCA